MAVHDDRTAHLDLPLPYPTNDLPDDVERLRQSFTALDAKALADDQLHELFSDELVELGGRITELEQVHLVEETQALADSQAIVNLAVLTSTVGAVVYIEGVRLKKTDWTPHETVLTRLTLNATYPAGHEITVERLQGGV